MRRRDTIPASVAFAITAPILDAVADSPDTMPDLPPVVVEEPAPQARITRVVPRAPVQVPAPTRSRSLVFQPGPPSYASLMMMVLVAGMAAKLVFLLIDGDAPF